MTSQRHPLSHRQSDILIERELAPQSPVHNIGGYHQIFGAFDPSVLERAIAHVALHSDTLRLVLRQTEDGVIQEVLPAAPVPFRILEASDEASAIDLARREMQQPFALFDTPLYRFALIVHAADRCLLHLVFDHVIADGWAVSVTFQRIFSAYASLLRGTQLELDYPSALDFVAVDHAYAGSSAYARDEAFWRARFNPLPPVLMQRKAASGRGVASTQASLIDIRIPRATYNALADQAAAVGATAFQCCMATIYAFFARLYGVDDLVLGFSLLNRKTAQQKQTIGMFASNSALRLRHGTQASIIDVCAGLAAEMRTAYRHHRYPVADLLRKGGPFAGVRERVCDINISYLATPAEIDAIDDTRIGPSVQVLSGHQQSSLLIFVADQYDPTGDVRFAFSCHREYFSSEELTSLGARFRAFFGHLAETPTRPLSQIPLLLEHERLLISASPTNHEPPSSTPLLFHEAFSARSRHAGDAIAIAAAEGTLSYAELERRANRIAHHLQRQGIGPDSVVGLLLPRTPAWITAMLGALKAGSAFLNIDLSTPASRLTYMLSSAQITYVLTDSATLARMGELPDGVSALDVDSSDLAECAATPPEVSISADNLAYLVFTSGSTGTPKGVMVPHRGLRNLATSLVPRFHLDETSRVLQFARPSFDASISEVILTLEAGGTLCMAGADALIPGPALAETLQQHAVTYVALPPSALPSLQEFDFPALRTLEVAGEACPTATARFWSARCRQFVNAYGPSENTVCATVSTYGGGDCVPIGYSLDNVQNYVLDETLAPVPIGTIGELFIGGIGLARGYLGQPALTAQSFVANPFGHGDRLYRSGDYVRYLSDGQLEFVGRRDHRVKIRGFRVELGEVEAALLTHPRIREAVVELRERAADDASLIAYLSLRSEAMPEAGSIEDDFSPRSLRAHLRRLLPDYMIPAEFLLLQNLPLTSHGKIDRAALAAAGAGAIRLAAKHHAGNAVESQIAAIFSEVLGVTDISLTENFFELGANSLQLSTVLRTLNQRLGLELQLVDVFRYPTISALAERAQDTATAAPMPAAPPMPATVPAAGAMSGRLRGRARRSSPGAPGDLHEQ